MTEQTASQNTPLTLDLKLHEVNTIIVALAEMPYRQSRGLIESVQAQAQRQLERKQAGVSTEGGSAHMVDPPKLTPVAAAAKRGRRK